MSEPAVNQYHETAAARLERLAAELASSAMELMKSKNHDYTSGSGDPFANFRMASSLGVDPVTGILIRMGDKLQRIRTFAEKGELKVKGEGLKDSALDLINYTALMYALATESGSDPELVPTNNKASRPAPVETEKPQFAENWDEAPDWANYWACDKDLAASYYDTQPVRNGAGWEPSPDCMFWATTHLHHVPVVVDWSRSLRCRHGKTFITDAGK